jgi:hypothetical protein
MRSTLKNKIEKKINVKNESKKRTISIKVNLSKLQSKL